MYLKLENLQRTGSFKLRGATNKLLQMPADALQKGYDRLGELAQRIAAVMSEWESASAQMEELGEAN